MSLLILFPFTFSRNRWKLKKKIPQSQSLLPILTPDGQQILIGQDKNEVLCWQAGFDNWQTKVKIVE